MEKLVSSAKVIDGTLILTLPDAVRPVVWQMQLGQTKSSALEVREQGGNWVLFLKTPRMDVLEIAPFSTKDAAVHALIAVSKAMEKASGQMGSGATGYPVPALIPSGRFGFIGRLARNVGFMTLSLLLTGIVLLALLGLFRWLATPSMPVDTAALPANEMASPTTAPSASSASSSQVELAPAGKAVPADEFLNTLQ